MTIDKALSNTVLCHEINVFIELFGKATVLKTGIFQRFFKLKTSIEELVTYIKAENKYNRSVIASIYFSNGRYALNI